MAQTHGLHHITGISSDPVKTYDFYKNILGLRFTKKTVNFDDPYTYHLYFGNETAEPGTALTFFPMPDAGNGMRGVGQTTSYSFAVGKGSLGFWIERFVQKGVRYEPIAKRFNESFITFYDNDGLQMELVATSDKNFEPWTDNKQIPAEHSLRGFYSVTVSVDDFDKTEEILLDALGYEFKSQDGFYYRYETKEPITGGKYIDIMKMSGWPEGRLGAGTLHHIAFRVNSDEEQEEVRQKLLDLGLKPTEQVERMYFRSVYVREPGGALFEIATDDPGFTVDETVSELGTSLKLPPWYEDIRPEIEAVLPELDINDGVVSNSEEESDELFKHVFVEKEDKINTFLLLHGTGGDETDLLPIARRLDEKYSILSLRGNVTENDNRTPRFFERYSDGTFNIDSIKQESDKLKVFLSEYKDTNFLPVGFSNGANMIASSLFLGSLDFTKAILFRPSLPQVEIIENLDLTGKKVFIAAGVNDEYISEEDTNKLVKLLEDLGAEVTLYWNQGTHQLSLEDIEEAKKFLEL